MKYVRCPACQTVFRVRSEQLDARRGEVRCGHCFNPFNAFDHLIAAPEVAAAPAPDAGRPAAQQVTPPPVAPPPVTPPPVTPPPVTPPPVTPTPAAPAAAPAPAQPAPASTETESAALDFEIPEVWRSARERQKTGGERGGGEDSAPTPAEQAAPPTSTGTPPPAVFSAALEAAFDGRREPGLASATGASLPPFPALHPLEPPTLPPDDPFAAADAEPAAEISVPPGGPEPFDARPEESADEQTADPDAEAQPAEQAAADDEAPLSIAPDTLDRRYGPASEPSAARRGLWALAVGLMLGSLAVQSAYLFREHITKAVPATRPLYQVVCAQFGCTLPLPRDIATIVIATSDLQSVPDRPGHFILHASVRNTAPYPQDWPQLELTLTDERDRPLVRRVLDPYEWAHAETAKLRAGFPAGREQVVRLEFRAADSEAAGYRLYLFYP
ncbi:DUF3426 domain-containing protein [Pseudothauera lacus]|uniref:Zinc finger/thioredoxin putative domain-containing protein n=1 Tax=Pseudothauera lacus TaxID=2136175 RepID=A0A2T4ID16_9RHOO|nr:DUF3426 domain-containing protein [Pseudothauera lacus]PTD95626.1 hypothetical protein C8261_12940 [Pseudothauera lacus]